LGKKVDKVLFISLSLSLGEEEEEEESIYNPRHTLARAREE